MMGGMYSEVDSRVNRSTPANSPSSSSAAEIVRHRTAYLLPFSTA